jgi:hypothetical protein
MCPPDRYKPPAVVPVVNRGAARAGVARGYRHVALGGSMPSAGLTQFAREPHVWPQ